MKKLYGFSLMVILFDQLIKNGLLFFLSFGQSITIIPNFFSITLVGNTGGAFSILSSSTILLIVISIVFLNLIYFLFIRGKKLSDFDQVTYGILIGGITGNLIDRVVHMQVIDYLDFNIFGYAFPIFNLADIAIVISMFLLIIQVIKGDKNEVSSRGKWY